MSSEEEADAQIILMKATKLLHSEFDFSSVTIQVERWKDDRWRRPNSGADSLLLPPTCLNSMYRGTVYVIQVLWILPILFTGKSSNKYSYSSVYVFKISDLRETIYSKCYNGLCII